MVSVGVRCALRPGPATVGRVVNEGVRFTITGPKPGRSMASTRPQPLSISGFAVLPVRYNKSATHSIYARIHEQAKAKTTDTLPGGRTLFLVNVPPDATERQLSLFFSYAGTIERVEFHGDTVEDLPEEDVSMSSDEGSEVEQDMETDHDTSQPRQKRKTSKEDHKKRPPEVVPLPTVPLRALRRSGQNCHVVFLDSSSAESALASSHIQTPRPWPSDPEVPTGLSHYLAQYDAIRPPLDVIRAHARTAIELYDYQKEKDKQKSKYKKGEAIVDEDGFTLVTRGGAYGKTLGGGVTVADKRFVAEVSKGKRAKKKKDKREKETFYAFQVHEKRRKGVYRGCDSICFLADALPSDFGPPSQVQTGRGENCGSKRKAQIQAVLTQGISVQKLTRHTHREVIVRLSYKQGEYTRTRTR
jgi:ribosomal RNA-processing protein 7